MALALALASNFLEAPALALASKSLRGCHQAPALASNIFQGFGFVSCGFLPMSGQDRRKSVRNEFFKVWLVCIPFQ